MKPVFSNTFNVTASKNKSEVALNFTHVYTEHKFMVNGGQLSDVSAQVCDDIASILLTKEGTVALTKLLAKIVTDWGVDVLE